jgi:hypothetical protein
VTAFYILGVMVAATLVVVGWTLDTIADELRQIREILRSVVTERPE